MNDLSQSSENTSTHVELSGVLLESVEEILREPVEERDLARALDRARQLAHATMPDRPRLTHRLSHNYTLERIQSMILTHKKMTIAMVAATTASAAGLIFYLSLFSMAAPAYALEQIAEAHDHVTSYHSKETYAGKGIIEAWVQLDQDGNLLRLRMDYPNTPEGPKALIWSKGKAETWVKATNSHYVLSDKARAKWEGIAKNRHLYDPRYTVEKLQAQRAAGKAHVTVKESANEGESTVLTITSNDNTDNREVWEVNSKTKLVERLMIEHRRHGDQWEQVVLREYFDYNKPIDPQLFQLGDKEGQP